MTSRTTKTRYGNEANVPAYLRPGRIGTLAVPNRLIRAATSETMAADNGEITDQLISFYSTLARGGAGLLITGHAYIEPGGQSSARQIGIYSDGLVLGLSRLTKAVHQNGGRIFCELSHSGSQSIMPNVDPIAPSVIENAIFERQPREMSAADVERIVEAFGQAARRAAAANFDGIHIHAGNGYLISQFNSPFSNRRQDQWGGDSDRRGRFLFAVYDAIRGAVGPDMPITARLVAKRSPPTALVTTSVLITLGVAEQLIAMNVDVPDALSIVGFGDGPWQQWWGPGLHDDPPSGRGIRRVMWVVVCSKLKRKAAATPRGAAHLGQQDRACLAWQYRAPEAGLVRLRPQAVSAPNASSNKQSGWHSPCLRTNA